MKGASNLRAFSAGMLISTGLLWSIQQYEKKHLPQNKGTEVEIELTEEVVNRYLEKQGYVIVSKEQYERLKNEQKTSIENQKKTTKNSFSSSPNSATVRIEKGTTAKDVALLLEKESIIEDALSFEHYLLSTRQTRKLRIGTYQLSENMTFREIGNILTKQIEY